MTGPDSASPSSGPDSAPPVAKRVDERRGFICLSVARMPSTIFLLTFFVPYLTLLAKHSVDESGSVPLLFASLKPSSVATGAILIASVLSAVFCPVLGALADFSPHRRSLLRAFALTCGVTFCCAVVVVRITWGIGFVVLIVMFFAGQAVDFLSNSYLAEIADSPGDRSRVSVAALRAGLLSQVTLLVLGMTVSYFFVPVPFRPNGTQFEQSTSRGFDTIRATSSSTLDPGIERAAIDTEWFRVADDTGGPVTKIVDTRFGAISSVRLFVRAAATGSQFVAFSESSAGAQLAGRMVSVNVVARPEPDAGNARVRVHLLSFDEGGRRVALQSGDRSAPFSGTNEQAFRLERTLPDRAHFLYYVVEVTGGAASITRLDVMEEDVYVVPLFCLVAGLWYLAWSVVGLRRLGERDSRHAHGRSLPRLILDSIVGLGATLKRTASDSVLARSLLAVALYSASAGSTLLMGPVFITEKLEISQFLIGLTTLCTIAGSVAGAVLFLLLGRKVGYNRALALAYLLWLVDMVVMFVVLRGRDKAHWLFVTVPLTGIASGGSLALARAVFASQIQPGLECELFGLFSFSQSFIGPFALFLFMAANEFLGDLQWGIASQTIFMMLAFALQISIREADIASRRAPQSPPGPAGDDERVAAMR